MRGTDRDGGCRATFASYTRGTGRNCHHQASDDSDQLPLFPVRSELAAIKDGTGAVKVETVLDEIAKLKQLRALSLPEALFRNVTDSVLRAKSLVSYGAIRPRCVMLCSPRCVGKGSEKSLTR
jgi:hypothetical protein